LGQILEKWVPLPGEAGDFTPGNMRAAQNEEAGLFVPPKK
jgi:hypothetical protein